MPLPPVSVTMLLIAVLHPISAPLQWINHHNLLFQLNLNPHLPSELIWLCHIYSPDLIIPSLSECLFILLSWSDFLFLNDAHKYGDPSTYELDINKQTISHE